MLFSVVFHRTRLTKFNYLLQYFGSATGVFRIFPGRHSRECGQYDPRVRPWYKVSSRLNNNLWHFQPPSRLIIAGCPSYIKLKGAVPSTISNTVKPRHVVMLLDKSLSMGDTMSATTNQTKLSYMKSMRVQIFDRFVLQNPNALLSLSVFFLFTM